MQIKTRFAPSPTGKIHIGNARAALFNYLFAHHNDGVFFLRIDDTDIERSQQHFEDAIIEDLDWLNIRYSYSFKQSQRKDLYIRAFEKLVRNGCIYPCYETKEELGYISDELRAQKKAPVYKRDMAVVIEGREPYWRFALRDGCIEWSDIIAGDIRFDTKNLSDPVVFKQNMDPLYMFCSVIDDCEEGVTHIIRGADHLSNTAVQQVIFEAMSNERPLFAHYPLLQSSDGAEMSKRIGSFSIAQMRQMGIEPMAILSILAGLGTANDIIPSVDIDMLNFDLHKVSSGTLSFSFSDIEAMNPKVIRLYPFKSIEHLCITEPMWNVIKENINFLKDVEFWKDVFAGKHMKHLDDAEFAKHGMNKENFYKHLLNGMPQEWTRDSIKTWLSHANILKTKKDFWHLLRLMFTGISHGPTIVDIMLFIGKETVTEFLCTKSI